MRNDLNYEWKLPRWGCWLLAIGFGLRLAYGLSMDPEAKFGGWDGKEYHAYAQNLAAFQGDDYPRFFNTIRAPFYPVFLMPFVLASKTALWPIQVAQSLIGILQVLILATIAGRWAGQRAGNWALVMATFHPFLIYFCAFVLTENVFITLLWLGIACLQRRDATTRRTVWSAVAMGLACLTRPALQPFLPVAVLWLGWQWRARWLAALGHMTLFTTVVCALMLPWMVGNLVVHHEFSLSPHGAQLVFAQSNSSEYLQTYEAKSKEEYYRALTKLHQRFARADGTPPENWLAEGTAFRREHPEDWWRLQGYKVRHFWTPWLNPMIFSRALFLISVVTITPTFVLAACEFWRRRKSWDPFLSLLAGLVSAGFLVGGLMFHVQVRYRIPFVDVTFVILSAAWLGYAVPMTKRSNPK